MQYQLLNEEDAPLDAHFSVEGDHIIVHSRGGSKGSASQRNADYSTGLRTLLDRLRDLGISIQNVRVDSSVAQRLPLDERTILSHEDASLSPEEAFRLMSSRMKDVGRREGARPSGGNSTKRIRMSLSKASEQR